MFKIKTFINFISAAVSALGFLINGNEEVKNEDFTLYINPFGNEKDSFDTIKWYGNEDGFSMFLPSDIDRSSLTVYFDGSESIKVNNYTLYNGEITSVFSSDEYYTIYANENSYNLRIFESANIDSMFLETKEPISFLNENKKNKCSAKIRTYENGEMTLDSELKQIKGRGNSTWGYPKKPYNIKFDKKTSVLGMPKAKKWTLLASYLDPILVKNPIAFDIANFFGMDFTSEYRFVDLYANNEYLGNYIVCEPVEIGENRIDIFDLAKATEDANDGADLEDFQIEQSETFGNLSKAQWVNIPNNPDNITGGYLLECDYPERAVAEVSYFKTSRKQNVVIKEPEYASKKQVEYIANFFQEAEDAISNSTGYNSLGKHFTEYFDIDSLVNQYILLELSENFDGGLSSTYFYKDKNGKLMAGPTWDSDLAFSNINILDSFFMMDPSIWVTNKASYGIGGENVNERPTIFNRLYKIKFFRDKVSERWLSLRKTFTSKVITEMVDSLAEKVKPSAILNAYRWFKTTNVKAFDFLIEMTRENLVSRCKYFDFGFSKFAALLYYDLNGGTGYCNESHIMMNGQVANVNGPYYSRIISIESIEDFLNFYETVLNPIVPPSPDLVFAGWNTKRDGTGKTYQPGDPIFMYGTKTLYAQWKEPTGDEPDYSKAIFYDDPLADLVKSLLKVVYMMLFD